MLKFISKMIEYFPFIKDLFQQAEVRVSRTHILRPLMWAMPILFGVAFVGYRVGAPALVCLTIFIISLICAGLFLFIYVYFAFKNPDLLRSEDYLIQKTIIEKGLMGDNQRGPLTIEEATKTTKLESGQDDN